MKDVQILASKYMKERKRKEMKEGLPVQVLKLLILFFFITFGIEKV
jgi:hypothetical protein